MKRKFEVGTKVKILPSHPWAGHTGVVVKLRTVEGMHMIQLDDRDVRCAAPEGCLRIPRDKKVDSY